MNNPEEITLSVPAHEIADIDTFERSRLRAYRTGNRVTLTLLAESTILITGSCLYNQFESILDNNPSSGVEDRTHTIAKLEIGSVFYDLVLGSDAEVRDIFHRVIIPEDTAVTEIRRRMANRVPYGLKQNGSCFVHRPLPARRHRPRSC